MGRRAIRRALGEVGEVRAWVDELPAWGEPAGPSFTCPRCGMTSHSPDDVREGYCGRCHDWTRDG